MEFPLPLLMGTDIKNLCCCRSLLSERRRGPFFDGSPRSEDRRQCGQKKGGAADRAAARERMKKLWVCLLILAIVAAGAGCGTAEIQEPGEQATEEPSEAVSAPTFGEFETEDVHGTEYTQDLFADHDLTLVNIMATWCTPCISEMPELQEIAQNMEREGVGVVGVILDARSDSTGETDTEAIDAAKQLEQLTGVSYPLLVPDEGFLDGWAARVQVVPTTYFVDSAGRIVAGPIEGSRDVEAWTAVIDEVRKAIN